MTTFKTHLDNFMDRSTSEGVDRRGLMGLAWMGYLDQHERKACFCAASMSL